MFKANQHRMAAISVTKKLFLPVVFSCMFCVTTHAQEKKKEEVKTGILCRQDYAMLGKLPSGTTIKFNNDDPTNTGGVINENGFAVSDSSIALKRIPFLIFLPRITRITTNLIRGNSCNPWQTVLEIRSIHKYSLCQKV